MNNEMKQCNKCLIAQPINNFCTDNSRPDKKKTQCRTCSDRNTAQWKLANREHVLAYHVEHTAKLREANKKKNLMIDLIVIKRQLEAFNKKYNKLVKLA